MKKRVISCLVVCSFAACLLLIGSVSSADAQGRTDDGPVIFVTSQELYYDTFVTADSLPPNGPFQKLEMGDNGPQTEYGPGNPGYLGGRWWVDSDGDNEMDADDTYFSCPLLGPGRESP